MIKQTVLIISLFIACSLAGQSLEFSEGYYYKNGMLYTGTHIQYYPDAKVKSVQHIINGQEDGITEVYFESGLLQERRTYKEGMKDGLWITYNESGVCIAEAYYEKNKKSGCWKIWDESGQLRYEMYYSEGLKTGTWKQWDAAGNLISEKKYD